MIAALPEDHDPQREYRAAAVEVIQSLVAQLPKDPNATDNFNLYQPSPKPEKEHPEHVQRVIDLYDHLLDNYDALLAGSDTIVASAAGIPETLASLARSLCEPYIREERPTNSTTPFEASIRDEIIALDNRLTQIEAKHDFALNELVKSLNTALQRIQTLEVQVYGYPHGTQNYYPSHSGTGGRPTPPFTPAR